MWYAIVPGWSSPASHRQNFVSLERLLLDDGRTLLEKHVRFPRADAARWKAVMMLRMRDDLMVSDRRVERDSLASVANLDAGILLTHPDVLARVLPRHRVATVAP